MVMMALLPPGGLLGGYGADPDGVNGSWEEACTCVSTSIRVRVAVAAGDPVSILATSHSDFSSLAQRGGQTAAKPQRPDRTACCAR